jgi:chromosomal replication initiation ATPase DnaA
MKINKTARIRICQIVGSVCESHGVTVEDLQSPSRRPIHYQPRAEAMQLIYDQTSLSYDQIGELFGRRSGCTVRLAISNRKKHAKVIANPV